MIDVGSSARLRGPSLSSPGPRTRTGRARGFKAVSRDTAHAEARRSQVAAPTYHALAKARSAVGVSQSGPGYVIERNHRS
eukprot:scaffold29961_cov65-Phaeocystis_antarctica.AAC.6